MCSCKTSSSGVVIIHQHHYLLRSWVQHKHNWLKVFLLLIHFCGCLHTKIQQTKMLVTCQRVGDLFLFGLVWQYSLVQTKYNKGRFRVMAAQTQLAQSLFAFHLFLWMPSYFRYQNLHWFKKCGNWSCLLFCFIKPV